MIKSLHNKIHSDSMLLLMVVFVISYCSMVYELLIVKTLISVTGGHPIFWQCLTIGIYIASLGIGTTVANRFSTSKSLLSLFKVELILALLGAIAVLYILMTHTGYRVFSLASYWSESWKDLPYNPGSLLFVLLSQSVTVAIGFFSGMEIPLVIESLSSKTEKSSSNVVLAVNYLGALVGALVFSLLLLPYYALHFIGVLTAFFNLLVCILFIVFKYIQIKPKFILAIFSLLLLHGFALIKGDYIYQMNLKNFFYNLKPVAAKNWLSFLEKVPKVKTIQTPYQTIHYVPYLQIVDYIDYIQNRDDLDFPKTMGYTLFINRHLQFYSMVEFYYHEAMVHIPIQLMQKVPRKILVLGAGDGLVVREIQKYKQHRIKITLVELDPKIIQLARTFDPLLKLNKKSMLRDDLTIIEQDAFTFLMQNREKFDAIIIDFPFPNSYDVSKLYSLEFYSLVNKSLAVNGFAVMDLPNLESRKRVSLQPTFSFHRETTASTLYSTLSKAGFRTIFPFRHGPLSGEHFAVIAKGNNKLNFKYHDYGVQSLSVNPYVIGKLKDSSTDRIDLNSPVNSIFAPRLFVQAPFLF